ncbi:hypothetical protein [Microcystis phage Mae-JY22]
MIGYRTIAANLIAAASLLLALVGVDLGQQLGEHGLDMPTLADQISGAINIVVALVSVVAGIWFRVKARVQVGTGKPLEPPGTVSLHPLSFVIAWFVALLAAAALFGCGAVIERDTTGTTAEQRAQMSVSEAIATAQISVTQTRALALDLLQQRQISPDTAEQANARLDEARSAIDAARALMRAATPDPAQARTRLTVATDAVRAARALLPVRTP